MSASHFPAIRATALQLTAALARYELHVSRLVVGGLEMDLYETVSEEIDEIKVFCAAVPGVAVPWAALLVSHAELIHALWRQANQAPTARTGSDVTWRLQDHLACIDVLARRCMRIAERHGDTADPGR
jgi:hypothetical protein